jgi:hypothetical protein
MYKRIIRIINGLILRVWQAVITVRGTYFINHRIYYQKSVPVK